MHPDLLIALKFAYTPANLNLRNLILEIESQEYGACTFELNQHRITFRIGKITPTKIGQFTTLWKRIGTAPIMPYDMEDPIDLFVISVRQGERLGQFVFPKDILLLKGFVSQNGNSGKRAMRVYPPWDITDSPQAKNTQAWQLMYFFEIDPNKHPDIATIKKRFQ